MRACSHCGQPAAEKEARCARCGARLDETGPASWQRAGLDGGAPPPAPDRLPEVPDAEPPPDWKNEVNAKLAAYRERQRTAQLDLQVDEPPAPVLTDAPESPGFYRPGVEPRAAQILADAAARLDAEGVDEDGNLSEVTTRRRSSADWRRVDRQSAEAAAPALPALHTPVPPAAPAPPPAPAPAAAAYQANETPFVVPVAPLAERAVAALLDLAVVVLALGIFVGLLWTVERDLFVAAESLRMVGIAFFMLVCFYWIFYVAFLGETAGMSWMGLRVLNLDGDAPTARQLRTRAFGTIISTVAAGLGFAWAALDIERLSWHDRMSKTFVARAAEAPDQPRGSHKDSGEFARAF